MKSVMKPIDLLKELSDSGTRVFSTRDVMPMAQRLAITPSYLSTLLRKLTQQGFIRKLFRGTFALSNTILAGPPLHEFEIAHALIHPSAICCWSAMAYHGLTDQVLRTVYLMAPYQKTHTSSSQYTYTIENTHYVIIRVRPKLYFGTEDQFIGEIPFTVTDIERTLLDGLVRPQYCGGFLEVIEAFRQAYGRIDLHKMMHYVEIYGLSLQKRLGWIFGTLGIFPEQTIVLQKLPCRTLYPLDVSKPNQGEAIQGWPLRRNF